MKELIKSVRWGVSFDKYYERGTFLLGANFNTNNEYYVKREYYVNIYLGKWILTIGRFGN